MSAILSAFVPGAVPPKGSSTLRWVGARQDIAQVNALMRQLKVRAFVVPQNENDLKKWQRMFRTAVMDEAAPQVLTDGVEVRATMVIARPVSAKRPHPTVAPDLDKQVRTLLDALSGGFVMKDDAQVVALDVVKRYARPGEPAGVEVEVCDAAGQEGLL